MGFLDVFRRNHRDRDSRASGPATSEIELLIPNMVCEGCAEKLDAALQAVSRGSPDARRCTKEIHSRAIRAGEGSPRAPEGCRDRGGLHSRRGPNARRADRRFLTLKWA